ncbi:Serine/threonine-protein kinase dkf-1 [Durusdinium trenchii]|uniref:Serine/threonine-protein kinase dkf-1 n=1 Tax=Durusdinium trenchii TaxID=1381693 RepID=A0ABP0M0V6_9DINO
MIRPDTLVALSALHPDPSVEVAQALSLSSLYGIADNFSEDEQQAIRDFRAAARSCYSKLGKKAKAQLIEVGDSIFAQSTVEDVEKTHDEETIDRAGTHEQFLGKCHQILRGPSAQRTALKNGASSLEEEYDLRTGRWLGNGKWGWVMMAPKRHGGQAVLKMSDVHHADVTAKEWIHGSKMGRGHRNIVEYLNVYLYGDENQTFKKKLQDGYRDGKLKSDIQRKSFPTHYVCMTIEEMNCGSVQGWLDKEILNPQGMMVVLQEVAAALAYMHSNEITHNDMKRPGGFRGT